MSVNQNRRNSRRRLTSFVDSERRQHGGNLSFHLSSAGSRHSLSGLELQESIMIPLRLRRKESSDTHRDGTRDEFSYSSDGDDLGRTESRELSNRFVNTAAASIRQCAVSLR